MLEAILGLVLPVINKMIPDPQKQAEVQAEITKTLAQNQSAIFDAMKTVMAADAASEGWMTRNARPLTVFWCLGMMSWVVLSPIVGLQDSTIKSIAAIPSELWNMSAAGIGAYIVGKSVVDGMKALKGK
jgi:uncharacterized membrane protein YccF (DUF307 family)